MSVDLDISVVVRLHAGDQRPAFELKLNLNRTIEVLAVFGPSGAGKTLALRTLAGLIRPTQGTIIVDGETWVDTARGIWQPAHRRQVGYVPQSSALFPHLSILENVCFGLDPAERAEPPRRVHELMERMGLSQLSSSSPERLSGGERQRVALARALVRAPRLLLLDEPMSALDETSRTDLRRLVKETVEDLKISTILVTHDGDEAATMAEEILLFEHGRTDRIIEPHELRSTSPLVHIQGVPEGPPEPLDDGRVRVRFERATITADPQTLDQATADDTPP